MNPDDDIDDENLKELEDAYYEDYEHLIPPDDYDPPEAEIFASVMSIHRDLKRKEFTEELKAKLSRTFPQYIPMQQKRIRKYQKVRLSRNDSDYYINKESIIQTYRDFLDYKKNSRIQSRLKDFEAFGLSVTKKTSQENLSNIFPKKMKNESFELICPSTAKAALQQIKKTKKDVTDSDFSELFSEDSIDFELPPSTAIKHLDFLTSHSITEDALPLKDKSIDENEEYNTKIEYLIKDKYYPGVIDDAVNRRVNYYELLFELSFGDETNIPNYEPEGMLPTLIEAFDMRVSLENDIRKNETKTSNKYPTEEIVSNNFLEYLRKTHQELVDVSNRDEVHAANAIEFDLLNVVRNRPDNGLNQAINSLFKAEAMNKFDKSQQEAEEAFRRAPPEYAETAAVHRVNVFQQPIKINIGEHIHHHTSKSYQPIEVISYMGVTKPNNNQIADIQYSRTKI